MSEKMQFDEFLGGSQSLPSEAHILKLASARANEIAAMTYSIDNPQQTKRVFQKLPVHMRRRIMSHNAKRMPRRLREVHLKQMSKSGLPPKSKRPSRKWRRRPQNLVSEYKRRQAKINWLETHVWHAKRFKIIDKWGFKIPYRSNNRCFRSSYRAVNKHCLIQDISYYSCIEINAAYKTLVEGLNPHCNPNGLTFAAKCYTNGNREGNVMFFERNGFPNRPVGVVQFIWRPGDTENRQIWIWVHPAIYGEILNQISISFGVKTESLDSKEELFSDDRKCRIVLLRNRLNRFRLFGPLSLSVLTDSLRLPKLEKLGQDEAKDIENVEDFSEIQKMEVDGERGDNISWVTHFYRDSENFQSFGVQKQVFELLENLKSPDQLPPSMIMAFTVLDPRFFIPKKRIKAETNLVGFEAIPVPPTLANTSPIWETNIREYTAENFKNTDEINKLRSGNLVPGVYNDLEYQESGIDKIPLLVIQRPGSRCRDKSIGFSSGIDVILPSTWATAFWISFIFRCAKPGGLKESKSIILENMNLNSPDYSPPDSKVYAKEALEDKYSLSEKYFRFPPNRRPNYTKLGISSPFYCEWNLLMKEWSASQSFYVLRDRKLLDHLKTNIPKFKFDRELFTEINCLITVRISIVGKGCPKDFAIICLPTREDFENFKGNKSWGGPRARIMKDANESERKKLRRGHLALLRRLRRQRIRQKEKMENSVTPGSEMVKNELKKKARTVVDIQAEKMKNLFLPECKRVRYSCDREVMGYVVRGDFSFSESKGVGIGYVTLSSLFELTKLKANIVLIRNTKTRQYRVARIDIII